MSGQASSTECLSESDKLLSKRALAMVLSMQQGEVNETVIYRKIASHTKDEHNREVLLHIADEEERHAIIWQRYSKKELTPQRFRVFRVVLAARIFGFTFAVKRMENGEEGAQGKYAELGKEIPEALSIREDEMTHEQELLSMLDEERLRYVGSMVLGLNDALVEITGTLAGLTLAMQNTRLIALSGLITGIAATLSMASSEFLSAKSDGREDAGKSSLYTGIAYVITVALLVLPFLLFSDENYLWALGTMLVIMVLIILVFNYYISVAQGLSFKQRFGEMALVSLGVAALSFVLGIVVKQFLGVDI